MCEQRATEVRRAGQYWPVLAVALGLYTVGGPSCSTTNVKCSSMVETPAQRVAACVAPSVVPGGAGTLSPESSSSPAPSHVVRGPDGLLASDSYPQKPIWSGGSTGSTSCHEVGGAGRTSRSSLIGRTRRAHVAFPRPALEASRARTVIGMSSRENVVRQR